MTKKTIPEHELYPHLAAREQWAWKLFYDRLSPTLVAVAMRYLNDRDRTKDVLQNSFVNMFSAIERFAYQGSGALKAWATKIVVNESLKELKDRSMFISASVSEENWPEIPEEEPIVENISKEELYKLILELPDGYRTVFNLFVFEEKSHREIARMLNIEENSSASQLHRAKKLLAQKIKAYQHTITDAL